jgi:OmcA/MtrC family decaheme c-type cytochrome
MNHPVGSPTRSARCTRSFSFVFKEALMRSALLAVVCLLGGVVAGCTGPRGVSGGSGTGCTVRAADGGVEVITCADGSSVSVASGDAGASCTVSAAADGGAKTITCGDGTRVTVTDGQPGTSCTVGTSDAGLKVITCADGTSVVVSPDPPPPPSVLAPTDELPGVVVQMVSLAGGSGPGGNFQIGDTVSVTFTVRTNAGAALPLEAMDGASIWIAGPTSNYQRVLPGGRDQLSIDDVKARAARNADGSYTYAFASPLPGVYGPPLYDTTKFTDGELTGQPLQHGSYTLSLQMSRSYTVGAVGYSDVGAQTEDFLLGTAAALEPRQVVALGNCNQCHVTLQAHGGRYRDTKLCVTCHTAGAEDSNSTDTGDATPVTIELAVMIHKLHDGAHLPSVLGVGTNADGTRSYGAAPVPYVVGGGPDASDFSAVQFPVWPSLSFPTPRNTGYSALTAAQQSTDDGTRQGVIACEKCHGDPDGAGPLAAPAQGDFAYGTPSRRACGSCHDDIDWTHTYQRNSETGMPAQSDDSKCLVCHPSSGFAVGGSPRGGHLHPLLDPTFNPGLDVALSGVHEAGAVNGNGKLDVGEKIAVTVNVTDDSGAALAAAGLPALSVVVTGPTSNRNLLLSATIPAAALTGTPPFTLNLPDVVNLELLGISTATTGDVFTAARTPIWNLAGAATTIFVRTATVAGTTLAGAAAPLQNFVDVASAAGFLRNDYLVVDDGVAGVEEYLRIQWVDGNRLWFAAAATAGYQPGLRFAHAAGAAVTKVTLTTKTAGTDYTIAAATGTITEVTELGAGAAVLASYTTDFVMPAVYGPPLNDSPDLGQAEGKWKGLPLVAGTYTVGVWGSLTLTLNQNGQTNSYRSTSPPATVDFLVGAATTLAPVAIISSGATCQRCHTDVYGHGGSRRGVDTCLLCHGSAGTEDRPRYVAAAAPATAGSTVEFRNMLHKIHRGSGLTNAATYQVVGFGAGAYPDNFSVLGFADVEFPAMPEGVKDCAACHGSSAAWQAPADRSHPTAATVPARAWAVACGSCHDSTADAAHFDVMTSSLGESCSVCHGPGGELDTSLVHEVR